MSVTATNLTSGPADLYHDAFGATEPADTAVTSAPAGTWDDAGGTQDGISLKVKQTYTELEVDQIVDVPERRVTKREISVETNLAEPTLENLTVALNGGTTGTGGTGATAHRTFDMDDAISSTQPTYRAILLDGWGPGYYRRRIIVRKVLNVKEVGMAYKKGDQTVIPVEFAAHYVSSSIKAIHIVDDTADA